MPALTAEEQLFNKILNNKNESIKDELSQIADVNFIKNGKTPLHVAVENNNYLYVRQLVDCGADMNHTDEEFRSLIEMTVSNNLPDILLYLLQHHKTVSMSKLDSMLEFCQEHYQGTPDRIIEDEKLIDYTVSKLTRTNISKVSNDKAYGHWDKYIAHLRSISGNNKDGKPVTGWFFDSFLGLRLRTFFEILVKIASGSISAVELNQHVRLTSGYNTNKETIIYKLKQEFLTDLEILHIYQHTQYAQNAKFDKVKIIDAIASNIENKIKQLQNNCEYSIAGGWHKHAVYINIKKEANDYLVRVDNLGEGLYDTYTDKTTSKVNMLHRNDTSNPNLFYSCSFYLGVGNSVKNYLVDVIKAKIEGLEKDKCSHLIYNLAPARVGTIIEPVHRSHAFAKQSVGNCTLENHGPGVRIRLGDQKLCEYLFTEELKIASKKEPANKSILQVADSRNLNNQMNQPRHLSARTVAAIRETYQKKAKYVTYLFDVNKSYPVNNLAFNFSTYADEQVDADNKEHDRPNNSVENQQIENKNKRKKLTINSIDDAFKSCKGQTKRILITADAGMGKSTLCQYIAYQWSIDSLWKEENKVICWIPLRNLTAKKYPKMDRNYEVKDIVAKEYGTEDGKYFISAIDENRIIWLLDGYDELPSPPSEHLMHAVKAFCNSSNVILTSRHSQIQNLPEFDLVLELENLSDENVKRFMQSYFTLEKIAENNILEFIKALQKNTLLWELAHIPLFMILICNIQMEQKVIELESKTEIYQMVMAQFLRHHLEKQGQPLKLFGKKLIKATKDICKDELHSLSRLAYQIFIQHLTAIDEQEIQSIFKKMGQSVVNSYNGFWSKPEEKDLSSDWWPIINMFLNETAPGSKLYEFKHPTLQEYLTALHIANAIKAEDLLDTIDSETNETKSSVSNFIAIHKNDPHYENIWLFVSGILAHKAEKLYLQFFLNCLFNSPHDMNGIYEMNVLFNCLEQAKISEELAQAGLKPLLSKVSCLITELAKPVSWVYKTDIFKILKTCPHLCRLSIIQEALAEIVDSKIYLSESFKNILDNMTNINDKLKICLLNQFRKSRYIAEFLGKRLNEDKDITNFFVEISLSDGIETVLKSDVLNYCSLLPEAIQKIGSWRLCVE